MNTIAVDAMGGDHAPEPEVYGALAAVKEAAVRVVLVGDEERLRAELERAGNAPHIERVSIRHASEVVTMDDHPGQVFRAKKDSSLRVAMELVKAGEADALVSAGNSGAVLSHALFVLGRLAGVERPGIATVLPTPTGTLMLCDSGANVEVKPAMLAQFAVLAAFYERVMHGTHRPVVGILSNGTEASKGTKLTREADALLRAADGTGLFEYRGYVEATSMFSGDVDVVATDGFTGNVVLKLAEGVSEMVMQMVKQQLDTSMRAKVGAPLVKPALTKLAQLIHYSEAGGALLLGVKSLVLIAHGRSDATALKNAIKSADNLVTTRLVEGLAATVERHHQIWDDREPKDEETA